MAYTKYNATPGLNNAAPPNGAPEGMNYRDVNDGMRVMMSETRIMGDGITNGAFVYGGTSAGGANIYQIVIAPAGFSALQAGMVFRFRAHQANTGAAVLNIGLSLDGIAAPTYPPALQNIPLRIKATALAAGDIQANRVYEVMYDAADGSFTVSNALADGEVTAGKLAAASVTAAKLAGDTLDALAGRKNLFLNGDFAVCQRATSANLAAGNVAYAQADRWIFQSVGAGILVERVLLSGDDAMATGAAFGVRITNQSGAVPIDVFLFQRIEDVQRINGGSWTQSVYARVSGGTVTPGNIISISRQYGTGGTATENSDIAATASNAAPIGTTWARRFVTATIPTLAGKTIGAGSHLQSRIGFTGLAPSQSILITGAQFERGATLTPFIAPEPAQELALCQRYFENDVRVLLGGNGAAGIQEFGFGNFKVRKRATPTLTQTNLSLGGGTLSLGTITINGFDFFVTPTGGTFLASANYTANAEL